MTFRIGIFGTGRMARDFTVGMAEIPDAAVTAIGSRTQAAVERFAREHSIPEVYTSYEKLAAEADIDLAYIATPHTEHARLSRLCLANGKPVLCEKAFAVNAEEARQVVTLAAENDLFVAEAMWSRHLPAYRKLRELLADKAIGNVQLMLAGGAFMPAYNPDHYLWKPELAGGLLLDAGVYLVSMASMLFGTPSRILAVADIGDHGVDEHDAILLQHGDGAIASLYISMRAQQTPGLVLYGDKGTLSIDGPVFAPHGIEVALHDGKVCYIDLPFAGNGYHYQVLDTMHCIAQGQIQSARMPHEETVAVMSTMDEIRRQIGLMFPCESRPGVPLGSP